MKLLFSAIIAALAAFGPASAATVQSLNMTQNQWTVLDLGATDTANMVLTPVSNNGSFSFTYAFSGTGCGSDPWWTCMPEDLKTGTVQTSWASSFGEGWYDKVNLGSVAAPYTFTYTMKDADHLFMFFRVTSGAASIAQIAADAPTTTPAPVPLPAAGLLLVGALGGLGILRARRKAA